MFLSSLKELSSPLLSPASLPSANDSWVFSLGKFDGFHVGHKKLIEEMRKHGNKIALFSFSNNPKSVLDSSSKVKMIQTLEHRIECARRAKIDLFLLEPFTLEIGNLPYDAFLELIFAKIPFKHLVLGEDARFGKGREGDQEHVRNWCEKKGIKAHYIPKVSSQGEIAGSKSVREAISKAMTQDDLKKVSLLLERPYSLFARFQRYKDRYALSRHHLEEILVPSIAQAHVSVVFEGIAFPAEFFYEPPFDLHLENLNLKVPSGIFEVIF